MGARGRQIGVEGRKVSVIKMLVQLKAKQGKPFFYFPAGFPTAFIMPIMPICPVNCKAFSLLFLQKKAFSLLFLGIGCAMHFANCCSGQSMVNCCFKFILSLFTLALIVLYSGLLLNILIVDNLKPKDSIVLD